MEDHELETRLLSLTKEFVSGLPEQLGGIETAWTRLWREGMDSPARKQLLQQAHSLAGAAGSLGFENIAKYASQLQTVLQSFNSDNHRSTDEDPFARADTLMQALRRAVYTDQQVDRPELSRHLNMTKADSNYLQEKRATRLIYIVEDDPIQASELAEQIGYFGYAVHIYHDPSELENAIRRAAPTAILMDVSYPEGHMLGYETVSSLRSKFPEFPPVIFITVNDQMPFRLKAVRVGGEAYFTKPVDVGALIDVLDRLVFRDTYPTSRVLIVEDSRLQANYIAMQLKKADISTEIVSDPLEVIDHMIAFNPDLLLLDMYMPECTGMELARVIRQMEQFLSVPIVFLSAETNKDKQLAALGLGGDDFLTKPIEPDHLISAVTTRIERYRKLRALMIQDGLTGLLNHSTTKERLVQEVERARRQNLPLAFAMIDLDHFKVVNDTYGHATGDRVLKSLAHMLKQRLRRTDTIGRFGGEEFAIILPNTDEASAAKVMNELCEGFAKIHHYSGEKEFSVTFSGGVAAYPDCDSTEVLSKMADKALYAAKASGRSQVARASDLKRDALPENYSPTTLNIASSEMRQPDNYHDLLERAKNAEADLTRTLAYLAALNRISQAVMNRQDLASVVTDVTCEVVDLFNAQHVGISLLIEDRSTLEFIGDSQDGWKDALGANNRVRLLDDRASDQVIQTGNAIFVSQAMTNLLTRGSHEVLRANRIDSRMIVPLIVRGQTIGTMNIDFEDPERQVVAADLELAETIAGSIASVIENSRLLRTEQRQREYFEALVRNLPTAVVTVDAQARIRSWNPAAENLFGYTAEEALNQNVDELLSSEEFQQEARSITQTISNESKLIHSITRRQRKDGSLAEVELLAVPVIVDGEQLASMAIYHDISDLQRARREAEAANEAKSAFLATMSHEIRTPLNAIVGMTTLLLDTQLTNEQRDFSDTIRNSSDALLTIINDILDFSKIEAGRMELEEQAFDLRECAESALDLVAAKATEKGIDLAYMIDPGVPAVIISDSTRLRQIFLNLLSNALKFTSEGEVVLSISAERLNEPGEKSYLLRFSVRDTGIGIPPERKELLFRSFSQLDASTTRKYGGTGLGLAISKRLAELMHGTMWVESEGIPGKGSTFHFTIRADQSTSPLPIFMHVKQPELSGKRVLIVDDNATNRYILMRQVQSWGMVPQETADPRQALQWICEGSKFDIALLDMQMPEMDGATLAAEITRCLEDKSEIPLVMLTSLGLKEADVSGVKFAAYLTKPIKPVILYSTLLKVFGGQPTVVKHKIETSVFEAGTDMLAPLRILLAEDTVVNQKVALHLLKRIGYRADVAGNGLEVLEALRRQPYDVILMDVQMPEMDGLETTRQVRSGKWLGPEEGDTFKNQPYIIAMTANAMQGDREVCLAAGMDDYLSKPIRVEELTRALKLAADARQMIKTPLTKQGAEQGIPSNHHSAIDEDAFRKFHLSMGEDNLAGVASLIQDYLDESPQLLDDMRQAAAQGDLEKLHRSSHSLKSSSMLFGALRLAEFCKTLEIDARDNQIGAIQDQVAAVVREFAAVEKELASIALEAQR